MKKILAFLLIAVLVFSLVGCGTTVNDSGSADNSNSTAKATQAPAKAEYKVGETWTVEGQWEVTITDFVETSDRNEFADKKPAAVYVVSFTWKNIGYEDASGIMNGLFINMDDTVIDSTGQMGYSYPGNVTDYPQETPVGASCKGQVCIGVDNAGTPIKLNVVQYDGNSNKQTAVFILE